MARFNSRWFLDKLADSKLTYRALGELMEMDHVLVHRMFNGKRKMSLKDAISIARIFEVSLSEITKQAGFSTQGELDLKPAKDVVSITGWVDMDLKIHWESPKGVKTAAKPTGSPKSVEVVRFLTSGSKLDALDGALAYFVPSKTMSPDCVGRQCVVSLDPDAQEHDEDFGVLTVRNKREQEKEQRRKALDRLRTTGAVDPDHSPHLNWYCCVVRKGRVSGSYTLAHLNGETLRENAILETASLVNWLKF